MKNIMFCIGLPRSGSTLLMNILNSNPTIYTTGTCPLPYVFDGMKQATGQVSEFVAMDMDTLDQSMSSFLRYGIEGWFQAQTPKPNVISKSRTWDQQLRYLFRVYDNPKFIVVLRDPRDVICSFEKLLAKYPHIFMGSREHPFEWNDFSKRIEYYCTDVGANLGRPLMMMPHVHEYIQRYPNNFFALKWEQLCRDPHRVLDSLYQWMELPAYRHDLNNIPPSDYVEHDAVYRSIVSHKTRTRFEPQGPQWPKYMTEGQSATVLHNLNWFYSHFYPEMLR
jgi:sulfotransferase